jgi:hypothetical protein
MNMAVSESSPDLLGELRKIVIKLSPDASFILGGVQMRV